MESSPVFFKDLAYVFAAAIAGGMLAWRLRQPVILGYVLAGTLISPLTPGPSVTDLHSLELAAELGVILLMFSVGLEFSVKDLMRAKWVALAGGPLGIILSMALGLAVAPLAGLNPSQGIVLGAIVSVASTMVLTRLLVDSGQLHTSAGRIMIAITLVEDLAVVVLTVIIPELGTLEPGRIGAVLGSLGLTILILAPALFLAAKVAPRLLGRVARTRSQELFFVVVLAVCMGVAALTQTAGLSLALGAFLAGLMISGSDYAHESLSQLSGLTNAFVALFFVSIGFLIDPRTIFSNLPLLGILIALIVVGKFVIWSGVVLLFRYDIWTALLAATGLTQIGEFSFILVQVAHKAGIVGVEVRNATLAASLVSILINAALVRYIPPRVERARLARLVQRNASAAEAKGVQNHVVICGFGRIGSVIGTALETFSIPYVVVELDPDIVQALRSRNVPCIFGDSVHAPVLKQAGTHDAALVIVAVPELDRARLTTLVARRIQPDIPILVRAHERQHLDSLLQVGATEIVQPELEAATTIIRRALTHLGLPDDTARDYIRAMRQNQGMTRAISGE